ncbi:hypothetical protein MMAD_16750 [Mycolicibacterium madagascariense]|uniref:Transcriptional regulator n=1 Tax=Mycolicibacterium madagascariense TaxID=212765 RepID=A0A7I7XDJ8_9MYCO|nr:ROK family transcriptional regulator [Mycolicibacterium madagascariense]MCV7011742.1 ROK family protein [Mycolicibacterium madagascariense]BBZ27380.1 hypothetical protein MMAD_16750 [Mycolicibacterium madagascariense]
MPASLAHLTDDAFLGVLSAEGAVSRAHVAKVTGISKPTISEAAQRLLAAGIIVDLGLSAGHRGRPTQLYDINPHYGHALGVALERGHVAVRVLNYRGQIVCDYQLDTPADGDLFTALADARGLVAKYCRHLRTPRLATAVSVAAPVDPTTSTIVQVPDAPFTGTVASFGAALGLGEDESVHVDNDVNWATLAEHRLGSMRDVSDFLYVYLGAGVGAGLLLGDRLHRGTRGVAGELAFTALEGGQTLMRRLASSVIGTDDGRSIDTARALRLFADDGPRTAELDHILDDLARVIVNVTTTIDPGRVVLGGPLAASPSLVDALRARIRRDALTDVTVGTSPLGRDAPISGAAIGALELARERRRQR